MYAALRLALANCEKTRRIRHSSSRRRYLNGHSGVETYAMHHRLWLAAILATTPILALSPVAFPAKDDPGCLRSTASARRQQREFMSLMRHRSDDAARRLGMFAIPNVKPREVKLVSDDEVCSRAALAYAAAVRTDSALQVYVLHIGGRFVVADAEQRRSVTFDSSFSRPLAAVDN